MKILSPGLIQESIYRATCQNCSCQIEFTKDDGEVVHDWRDGDFIKVNCPTCHACITKAL